MQSYFSARTCFLPYSHETSLIFSSWWWRMCTDPLERKLFHYQATCACYYYCVIDDAPVGVHWEGSSVNTLWVPNVGNIWIAGIAGAWNAIYWYYLQELVLGIMLYFSLRTCCGKHIIPSSCPTGIWRASAAPNNCIYFSANLLQYNLTC